MSAHLREEVVSKLDVVEERLRYLERISTGKVIVYKGGRTTSDSVFDPKEGVALQAMRQAQSPFATKSVAEEVHQVITEANINIVHIRYLVAAQYEDTRLTTIARDFLILVSRSIEDVIERLIK